MTLELLLPNKAVVAHCLIEQHGRLPLIEMNTQLRLASGQPAVVLIEDIGVFAYPLLPQLPGSKKLAFPFLNCTHTKRTKRGGYPFGNGVTVDSESVAPLLTIPIEEWAVWTIP